MIANYGNRFRVVNIHTPLSFEGVTRPPMLSPGGASFFCPCCPIGLTRPMYSATSETASVGERIAFHCRECGAIISAIVESGKPVRTPFGL